MVRESLQRMGFFLRALTQRKLDGLDLLESDHIRVETLFFRWRMSRRPQAKEKLFQEIKKNLLLHAELEEEVFYPTCSQFSELKEYVLEAYEEHEIIVDLLKEISQMPQKSQKAHAKVSVLMEQVEHHVREEENSFFPQVRLILSKVQFDRLSRDIRTTKQAQIKRMEKLQKAGKAQKQKEIAQRRKSQKMPKKVA
jgi:hemerythrin superfamily protein